MPRSKPSDPQEEAAEEAWEKAEEPAELAPPPDDTPPSPADQGKPGTPGDTQESEASPAPTQVAMPRTPKPRADQVVDIVSYRRNEIRVSYKETLPDGTTAERTLVIPSSGLPYGKYPQIVLTSPHFLDLKDHSKAVAVRPAKNPTPAAEEA